MSPDLHPPLTGRLPVPSTDICTAPPNRQEKIWLVLWEAGIVIQIPIGVLFLYPSALIMHFNIKREGQSVFWSHVYA